MLTVEYSETYGWESAIRGMRNPMNSWDKSDCYWDVEDKNNIIDHIDEDAEYGMVRVIGPNDLDLIKRLRKGGPDDRKYLRQIFVSCDITAPLYWWKEMDQYKVSTVTNSCSTMHKIASKEFVLDDFSHEHLDILTTPVIDGTIKVLNSLRDIYNEEKDKEIWYQMIQLLPSSYNQRRTWTANYEVLTNIYHARKNHKLDEWHTFCNWISNLPYAKALILGE